MVDKTILVIEVTIEGDSIESQDDQTAVLAAINSVGNIIDVEIVDVQEECD